MLPMIASRSLPPLRAFILFIVATFTIAPWSAHCADFTGSRVPVTWNAAASNVHHALVGIRAVQGVQVTVTLNEVALVTGTHLLSICYVDGTDGTDCHLPGHVYTCVAVPNTIGSGFGFGTGTGGWSHDFPAGPPSSSGGCLQWTVAGAARVGVGTVPKALNEVVYSDALVSLTAQHSLDGALNPVGVVLLEASLSWSVPKAKITSPVATISLDEGVAHMAFFSRDPTNPGSGRLNVDCSATFGSASAADVTISPFKMTWNHNDVSSQSCSLTITDDLLSEGKETFTLTLSAGGSSPIEQFETPLPSVLVKIVANDKITFTLTPTPEADFESVTTRTFSLVRACEAACTLPSQMQTWSLSHFTTDASDISAVTPATINWAIGQTSKTISLNVNNDAAREDDENFGVQVSMALDGTNSYLPFLSMGTILDDDRHAVTGYSTNPALFVGTKIPTLGYPTHAVTVTGLRFDPAPGTLRYVFGPTAGAGQTLTYVNANTATTMGIPSGAGASQLLRVFRDGLWSDADPVKVMHYELPSVTSHSPTLITAGSPLTLFGSNFGPGASAGHPIVVSLPSSATSGSSACASVTVNAGHSEIVCNPPAGSAQVGTVNVTVTEQSDSYDITAPLGPPPVINQTIPWIGFRVDAATGVSRPASHPLTITGTGFAPAIGGVSVVLSGTGSAEEATFSNTTCVIDTLASDDTRIVCTFETLTGGEFKAMVIRNSDGVSSLDAAGSLTAPEAAIVGRIASIVVLQSTAAVVISNTPMTVMPAYLFTLTNTNATVISNTTTPGSLLLPGGTCWTVSPPPKVQCAVNPGLLAGITSFTGYFHVSTLNPLPGGGAAPAYIDHLVPLPINVSIEYGQPLNVGLPGGVPTAYSASDTTIVVSGSDLEQPLGSGIASIGSIDLELGATPAGPPTIPFGSCTPVSVTPTQIICTPSLPLSQANATFTIFSFVRRSWQSQPQSPAISMPLGHVASGVTVAATPPAISMVRPVGAAAMLTLAGAVTATSVPGMGSNLTTATVSVSSGGALVDAAQPAPAIVSPSAGVLAATGTTLIDIGFWPVQGATGTVTFEVEVGYSLAAGGVGSPVLGTVTASVTLTLTAVPGPSIAAVSPSATCEAGGTVITINGAYLGAESAANVSQVTLGGTACASWSWVSSSVVTCAAPPSAPLPSPAPSIELETVGLGSATSPSTLSVVPTPTVTLVTPSTVAILSTAALTTIDVLGSGFGAAASDVMSVTLAGVPCTSVVWNSSTALQCQLAAADLPPQPALGGPISGGVTVSVVPGCTGVAGGTTFSFQAPVITAVNPNPLTFFTAGPAQAVVVATLSGSLFGATAAALVNVTVAGRECDAWSWVSPGEALCSVPAHLAPLTSAQFAVRTVSGGSSSLGGAAGSVADLVLTAGAPITIASFTPATFDLLTAAGPSFNLTVIGTGLDGVGSADAAGISCTALVVLSDTELVCTISTSTVPQSAPPSGSVVLFSIGSPTSPAASMPGFSFTVGGGGGGGGPGPGPVILGPMISLVHPATGSPSGGVLIHIRGYRLENTTAVRLGGAANMPWLEATSVTVVSDTHVTCITPAHPHRLRGVVHVVAAAKTFSKVPTEILDTAVTTAFAGPGAPAPPAVIVAPILDPGHALDVANVLAHGYAYVFPPPVVHDVSPRIVLPGAPQPVALLGEWFEPAASSFTVEFSVTNAASGTAAPSVVSCGGAVAKSEAWLECDLPALVDGDVASIARVAYQAQVPDQFTGDPVAVSGEGTAAIGGGDISIVADAAYVPCTDACGFGASCVGGSCVCAAGFSGPPGCDGAALHVGLGTSTPLPPTSSFGGGAVTVSLTGGRWSPGRGPNVASFQLIVSDDGGAATDVLAAIAGGGSGELVAHMGRSAHRWIANTLWITANPGGAGSAASDISGLVIAVEVEEGDGVTVRAGLPADAGAFSSRVEVPITSLGEPVPVTLSGVRDNVRDGNSTFVASVSVISGPSHFSSAPTWVLPVKVRGVVLDERPTIVEFGPALAPMIPSNLTIKVADVDTKFAVFIGGRRVPHVVTSYFDAAADITLGTARRDGVTVRNSASSNPTPPSPVTATLVFDGDRTKGYHDVAVVNLFDNATLVVPRALYVTDDCPTVGMYGKGSECRNCPKGGICPGGNRIWPEPGYWNPDESSGYVVPCDPPEACTGHTGDPSSTCAVGYEGEACGGCTEKFYRSTGLCEQCPKGASTLIYIICDCILWTLFGVCGMAMRDRMAFSYVVMVVRALQSLAGIGEMGDSTTPKWVRSLYSYLHLFSGDYSFVQADCVSPVPYPTTYFVSLTYNIAIMLPAFFFLLLGSVFSSSKRSQMEIDDPRRSYYGDRSIRMIFIGLTVAYLPITATAFEAISCLDVGSGRHTMITRPDVVCYEGAHIATVACSCMILIAYTIGYPLLVLRSLRSEESAPKLHTDERFMERWNFFYEFYNPNFPTFFVIEYPIMCIVAAGKSLLKPHVNYQMSISVAVFAYKLIYIIARKPFIDWLTDVIQAVLAVISMIAINITFFTRHGVFDSVPAVRDALSILVFVLLAITVAGILAFIVYLTVFGGNRATAVGKDGSGAAGCEEDGSDLFGDNGDLGPLDGEGNIGFGGGDGDGLGGAGEDNGWFGGVFGGSASHHGQEENGGGIWESIMEMLSFRSPSENGETAAAEAVLAEGGEEGSEENRGEGGESLSVMAGNDHEALAAAAEVEVEVAGK